MIETVALPDPLHDCNGRTTIVVQPDPDAPPEGHVIAAPGYKMFVAGAYNTHPQVVPIEPGQAFGAWMRALEEGRAIANRGDLDGPPSDRTIVAALRLALVENWAKDKDALAVARAILDTAAPTDPDDKAGVRLMVQLIREQRLRAEVTS